MKHAYSLYCPNCGAELEPLDGKDIMFCQYCGQKIFITDDSVKTININKNVTTTTNETKKIVINDKAAVADALSTISMFAAGVAVLYFLFRLIQLC